MKYKTLMAKALYDNTPESPEELLFRRGDILTVLEQNTGGLEGWWLCSLHGRQGIAPGNRLKLLIGPMFDGPPPVAQTPPPRGGGVASGLYQVPPGQEVYQVPPQRNALAADHTPSKVVTPTRVGRSYTYGAGQHNQQDLYDVPPTRSQGVYDVPPGKLTGSPYSGLHGPGARPQGVYDIPPSGPKDPRAQGVYDIPPSSQGVYSVPPCRSSAASVQEGNYDFPQPIRHKQEGVYDVPPPAPAQSPPQSSYDFPPAGAATHHASEGVYDVPPSSGGAGPQRDLYDFPRGKQTPQDRDRGGGKGGVYDAYDVLPPPQADARALGDVTDGVNRLSFSSTGSSMSTSSSSASSEGRPALDPDAAVQTLSRLQQAVEASSGALQALAASPHWRTPPFMERHAQEVRGALERVRAALGDLVAFGRAAAANATALSDPGLHGKLRRQLGRLEDSHGILLQTYQALESAGWAPRALAPPPTHPHHHHHVKTDDLDRFVMVARTVPDDAKQLASAIGGSAELLFRRALAGGGAVDGCGSRGGGGGTLEDGGGGVHALVSPASDQTKPFPVGPGLDKDNRNNSEKCVKSWMEDYDYVHLQGKEDFERQQKELLEKENIMKQSKVQLGQEQINQFKQLEQEVIQPVENDMTQWMSHQQQQQHAASSSSSSSPPSDSSSSPPSLGGGAGLCARDRQLLCFYSAQCQQHFVTLLNAVDAFFSCVGAGQPPRIFVAHGKLVILSAHKLVFIGDTLSRQAAAPEVADRVMSASNVLCALLKTVVGATKTAALRYPSTGAVQDMVDRVTDLSHRAQQFSQQLLHMAAL